MSRLPVFRPQIGDPTTSLDSHICTLESGAMALDFTTGGGVQVWGGQLIPYCGRSPSEIAKLGTNLGNVDLAWKHWGQDLDVRDGPWSDVMSVLHGHDALILQGDYGALPDVDTCSTFDEGHAVYVHPEFSVDGKMVLTGDPLCSGYRWRTLLGLRSYAETLAQQARGDRTRLFYGRAPRFVLPDTDTEDTVTALKVTKLRARSGVATVKSGPKRAAVQIQDREYFWFSPGATKRYVAEGILVPPLDNNPGDRASVIIVGDEAAVFLKMDVDLKDDASEYNAGVVAASTKALEAKH